MNSLRKIAILPLLLSATIVTGCSQPNSSSETKKNVINCIDFLNHRFIYYEDGSGSLHLIKNDNKTLELQDIKFKESNINKIKSSNSFENIIENIGFPRFNGVSNEQTLDFGQPDENIFRISFSNDGLYEKLDVLDYTNPSSWLDPNKNSLPTLNDIDNIKIGMSLDDVVSLIGKPQGSSGYGAIIFNFAIDDGSTLVTWWNSNQYSLNNGPYYLYKMNII